MNTNKLTRYSMVIAITVCLNILFGSFSFGLIQIRISELLLVLVLFDKGYTYPLTLACMLSNLIGMSLGMDFLPLDFIFGTLATLVSCLLMVEFKNILFKGRPLLSLFIPSVVNGIVIGAELTLYFGGSEELIKYFFIYGFYVFVGEMISITILGLLFYKTFEKLHKKLTIY